MLYKIISFIVFVKNFVLRRDYPISLIFVSCSLNAISANIRAFLQIEQKLIISLQTANFFLIKNKLKN